MRHLVVMGVAGCGKSTLGRAVAERTGRRFIEGDDLHPASNRATMAAGRPLTDADRVSWLAALVEELAAATGPTVLSCSALKRSYRDVLRGVPEVAFCHLSLPKDVLAARLAARSDHFMPASLLDSQLATLEPLSADEPGWTLSGELSLTQQLKSVEEQLNRSASDPS